VEVTPIGRLAAVRLPLRPVLLKTEPVFTPIMAPETYGEAIANAKKILSPQPE
jgi:hypothetical protein